MGTMRVLDYTAGPFGLVVTRSAHYLKEHDGRGEGQLGIVVDLEFYMDASDKVICWPNVHWEGCVTNSVCHPANIVPYRDHELAVIEMDE